MTDDSEYDDEVQKIEDGDGNKLVDLPNAASDTASKNVPSGVGN